MDSVTKNSNFSSISSQVAADKTTINSLKTSYSTAISTAKTKLNAVDFTGWDDSVSTKVKSNKTSFSSFISTLDKDTSTGNLNVLITKLGELVTQLDNCKSIKSSLSSLTSQRDRTTKYKEGSTTEKTQEYLNIESSIRSKERELDTAVSKCNSLIKYINEIAFNSALPAEAPDTTPLEDETTEEDTQEDTQETVEEGGGSETPANPFELYGESDIGGYPLYEATYTVYDEDGNPTEYEILINGTTGALLCGNRKEGYYFIAPTNRNDGGAVDGWVEGSYGAQKHAYAYEGVISDDHQNHQDGFFDWGPESTYGGEGGKIMPGEGARSGNSRSLTIDLGDGHQITVCVPAGPYADAIDSNPADFLSQFAVSDSGESTE